MSKHSIRTAPKLVRAKLKNSKRLAAILFFLPFISNANAQDFEWQKDVPGKLFRLRSSTPVGLKLAPVFSLLERIPIIAHPKGFDVRESFAESTVAVPLQASVNILFAHFYRYNDGPVQQSDAHLPSLSVTVNDPKMLMYDHDYLFSEETGALHLPQMFTDTFPVTYQNINGYRLGVAVSTQFGRKFRMYILNPRRIQLFRPVTKEEYLQAFVKNLNNTIEEQKKGLQDSKKTITDFEKMEQFAGKMDDLKQVYGGMMKWVAFLEGKRDYFKNRLNSLSPVEKKMPAVLAWYKNVANMTDRDHNYVDEVSGHLPAEPLESTGDTLSTQAVYTFNEKMFDQKLPKNAFQLMVITEAFQTDIKKEMKFLFDKELYPHIPFKELAALMYK